ncbi:MAG: GntR family transcriptional regulator [Acidobacteriota bacterium]|nr:GntR family transcriptional regulator [Acidobacteriota bacterium]
MSAKTKRRKARKPARALADHRERSFDTAYRKLRELIVHGRLAPGTRVVEADIARRLEISRTPVRSALHRLQQEGYVAAYRSSRQARLAVAPLTKEDSRELYWIIGHIEGLAGRLLAQLNEEARARVAERLLVINTELSRLAGNPQTNPSRIFDLDMGFHQVLVESAAGPRLLALHAAIKPQTERYWRLYASAIVDQLGESVAEHKSIIQSIERGDPDATEHAIQRNWQCGAERLGRVIESRGERGSW